ncbi:MAG: hypothetical protein M1825_004750 [Sarcosagium campestre]|nr:MAG: hypothetical protein M1825_004750 [Sarcosagium campestre]
MGLGILRDASMEHVPGTVNVLEDETSPIADRRAESKLKFDSSGPVPIILVPQPSDDPNDPLNWPLWKRDVILVVLSIVSVMAAACSPILAANTLTLSLYFRRDFTAISLLTGYHLCGVGVAGVLFVASARVWGKRHLYLLGTVLLIVSSAWAGASTSYKSLLWARIIQGVGVAPFEALVNASVGDLYFVHQRGVRMALSNLALFGSAFFTPILVGKITNTIGWQWTFYFIAIFAGLALPFVIMFVPETAYRRAAFLNTDLASTEDLLGAASHDRDSHLILTQTDRDPTPGSATEKSKPYDTHGLNGVEPKSKSEMKTPQRTVPEKDSFARRMLPFNGRKTDQSFWKLLLRPFPLFFHPAIFWACLIQGTLIGWTVLIGVVLAAIFLGPPLFFDEVKTGYMYTGAFVGALLGFILSGVLADWSARFMTARNRGVYEPEFRILLVIPQLICGCAGLYGFGITSADVARYGPYTPDVFFGLEVMGMVIGAVASALYIVDAHRDISVEAFTCLLMFKNLFSFGLTWSAYDWILESGIRRTFVAIGSVQLVVCLLSIPMYILGKKNRSFFHRHDILELLGLRRRSS